MNLQVRAVPKANTIFHTIESWGPGGAETVCVELAAGLDRNRFRSVASAVREGWVYDAMGARGLCPILTRGGRGPISLGYMWRIATYAKRQRAALIQSHLLMANLYCALTGRLLGIPSVATFHGTLDVAPDDSRAAIKMGLITSNASRLVFVSDPLRRFFCSSFAVPAEKTVVIANGIDTELFFPAPNVALRAELGISDNAVLIGAVGNVRSAKGYDDLLRVAAVLRNERPEVRIVVVGERTEPLYSQLLAQRSALGLEGRVFFLGFRQDIPRLLNGIDVYVSSSTSEGFSLTTIQAMACGLPVVATRSGGPEQIITDGKDGRLVPVGDAAAIAAVIAEFVDDPARRRALGGAGRDTVLRRFTLGHMVRAYETIYDDLLGRS